MKVLIIGGGAREHAIAYKISQNSSVDKIYCAPGNVFNHLMENTENVNLKTVEELLTFAKTNKIDLTIVGSEALLVEGIVDEFKKEGLKIFGPDKKSAMLEGSKAFAKDFMKKYSVKTAKYKNFTCEEKAIEYLDEIEYPIVIKASGLAEGKGVIIAKDRAEAEKTIKDMMTNKIFKDAASTIVIEEFIEGVEASILSITDCNEIITFISAKDHKKISEGEKGLNTGGMGVIAPNPYFTKEVEEAFKRDILEPTLRGLKEEKMDFAGIIFFGLMISKNGVYLLEYNLRMGDPETQAVLELMESDYLDLLNFAMNKKLSQFSIEWKNKHAVCVVASSKGYPLAYEKGLKISGIEDFENNNEAKIFTAGVKYSDGEYFTNGGRVLSVVALADSLEEARSKSYEAMDKIDFEGKYFRKDIGKIY